MSGASDGFYINASNYKDYTSAHLPEGEYHVRLIDLELTETKKNSDPMVNAFFTVVGGPYNDSPLIDRWVLTDKTLFRVVPALRALGLKVEKRNMQIPFKLLLGRMVVVRVSDGEPYNGDVKSEIRSYAPTATFKGYDFLSAPVEEKNASNASGGSIEDEEEVDSTDASDSPPWEADEATDPTAETATAEDASAVQADATDVPDQGISL